MGVLVGTSMCVGQCQPPCCCLISFEVAGAATSKNALSVVARACAPSSGAHKNLAHCIVVLHEAGVPNLEP